MPGKNTAVFGLYPDETELAEGIEQLKRNGFRTADLSVLIPENLGSKDIGHEKHTKAPEGAVGGGIAGAIIGGVLTYLGSEGILNMPSAFVGPLATAGPVMAVLAGIGAFTILGAILGALAGASVPEYEAKRYDGRIRSGGVLLSVHCDSADWHLWSNSLRVPLPLRGESGERAFASEAGEGFFQRCDIIYTIYTV